MDLKYRLFKRVAGVEEDSPAERVFDGAYNGYRLYGALGLLWEVHEPTRQKLKHDRDRLKKDAETVREFKSVVRRYL